MIRAHELRYRRMEGARVDAESMDLRAAEAHARYEKEIAEARREAVGAREAIKTKAEESRRHLLEAKRHEASTIESTARGEREERIASARTEMEARASDLADAIVTRLLGDRGVGS